MAREKLTGKLETFRRGLDKQRIDWNFIFSEEAPIDDRLGAAQMLIKRGIVTLPVWPGDTQPSNEGLWRVQEKQIGGGENSRNPTWYIDKGQGCWYFTAEKYAEGYAQYLHTSSDDKWFVVYRGVGKKEE